MPSLNYSYDASTGTYDFIESRHAYRVRREGRGQPTVTLSFDGAVRAMDRIDLGSERARQAFAGKFDGQAETVERELLVLAIDHGGSSGDPDDPDGGGGDDAGGTGRAPSQATAMVALALAAGTELFHDADGEPYATFSVGGHLETTSLKAKVCRNWLAKLHFDRFGGAPGTQAIQEAITTLGGPALFDGQMLPVWYRLAPFEGRLYLDLGDEQRRAVEIDANGWRIVDSGDVPVKFRRPRGMLALPEPDPTGALRELGRLVNIEDPDALKLVIGWLLGTFCTDGGRPILELLGEQGSCKTTAARMLRRIVDPCSTPLRTMPRNERDMVIAASNGLVVCYDNVSELTDWQSDALCRLSTGGGISGRELYTDLDEVVLNAQRACLLTAINSVATRSDLGDRTMNITLPSVPAEMRRTESALWADFDAAHPRLLGGLLNAVSTALANRDGIDLPRKPRLADFVAWVEAAAPALGWAPGEFLDAFEASREDVDAVAIEALPIGPAVLAFMRDRDEWQGTASALLTELGTLTDDATQKDRDWPKRANRLSGQLRRIAPNLRQVGLWVGWDRTGNAGTREVILTKNNDAWDRQHRRPRQQDGSNPRDDVGFGADDAVRGDRQQSSATPQCDLFADDADDADDGFGGSSGAEQPETDAVWVECCLCGDALPPGHKLMCESCGAPEDSP